ncbi:DUF2478 domain-containing protein [Ruegeria sp. 2205SS24-7]|uniref:DUF2478 domain-containing protein n=1 Tax=Ruegeria discodermiae TaxID=3064389 RepID=UPI0027414FDA|nr:DUF2478 domain-containing protein [Ruegeria sp. 2205SS24-7]MDP5217870.1 DUF2478 domain-containing protein [Ruegeria sp. 2205SS24-7]
MKLACVTTTERGATDLLLSALAERLLQAGTALAGVVQTNTECADGYKCDMDLKVLPTGETIRISQSLGANARGCRLDPSELERSVGLVTQSLDAGPELLIINKFGKHEADGRGFRPVIADALEREIPVLVGVNGLNLDRFQDFAGGMADVLDGDIDALQDWFDALSPLSGRARAD